MDALWVGSESGMEESLVKRQGISFRSVPAAGLHGVGVANLPRNLTMLGRGVLAARRILNEFKPDVMFFTGGYVAVPVAIARSPRGFNRHRSWSGWGGAGPDAEPAGHR